MGLWLVIYLIEHLIVNSQATLWIGDDGSGFVRLVNSLESLPYLQVIETIFIGVPLAIHGVWGVRRVLSAKKNALPYERNRAFNLQRLSSWILLFGIIGHVIQMRFVEIPKKIDHQYVVKISDDPGLHSLANRLNIELVKEDNLVIAKAPDPGSAMLLMVRDTFKSPLVSILYTIFLLAATFHAFNGLWTACITWGAMLSYRSQKAMLPFCWVFVGLFTFLGLAAIWGSYWINLKS
jgi:succinate dehydrogenase / fumarate reductase cytochrome b subunit